VKPEAVRINVNGPSLGAVSPTRVVGKMELSGAELGAGGEFGNVVSAGPDSKSMS